MIDRTFLEKIEAMSAPTFKEIEGRQYANRKLYMIEAPTPSPIGTSTLQSVVDYINSVSDEDNNGSVVIQICGPTTVDVMSNLSSAERVREQYMRACCLYEPFAFGRYVSVEQFIIQIQAMFVQDETTANILRVVGNLKAEASKTLTDDGCTQQVIIKAGIAGVIQASIPNPVTLRPYRTFAEIEQPASQFVFRMKDTESSPQCALYEADGGRWKIEAIANIKSWLEEKLPTTVIVA